MRLRNAYSPNVLSGQIIALREYFISPLLVKNFNSEQYVRRRETILHRTKNMPLPSSLISSTSIHEIRTKKLLDSGLSGAFAGAILFPIKRTYILSCFRLQIMYAILSSADRWASGDPSRSSDLCSSLYNPPICCKRILDSSNTLHRLHRPIPIPFLDTCLLFNANCTSTSQYPTPT